MKQIIHKLNGLTINLMKSFKSRFFKRKFARFVILSAISACLLIVAGIFLQKYLFIPRAPEIKKTSDKSAFYYQAKNNIFSAFIGTKRNNNPEVRFAIGDSSVNFVPASARTELSAPEQKDSQIIFKNVYPDTDYIYQTLPDGIKEDIIINKQNNIINYPFLIAFTNASPQYVSQNIFGTVFYDASKKYLFHFQRPFATDAKGVRTNLVGYTIRKDKQANLLAILAIDQKWLNDPKRAYPITIDPTIVHNTSSQFATGVLNRITDTGSGSSPNLTTYFQELPADQYTLGLYHFNNGGCTTDSSLLNANILTANGGMTCSSGGQFDYKASGFATTPVSYSQATLMDVALASGTIEAWINPSNLTGTQTILYADSTNDTLLTLGSSGQVNFSTSGSTNLATGNSLINTNVWSHIAATWTSTGHKIYINGVEQASDTNTTTHTSQDYTTYIGVGAGGNTNAFSGSIDEVRISSIARTPEEIRMDAQRRPYGIFTSPLIDFGLPIISWNSLSWTELGVSTGDGETLSSTTSLVAQWNLNSTSGTTATNDAGVGTCGGTATNCDLTLNNFASTGSQDAAAGSGWTVNNKRWGAGAIMLSSAATADTLSVTNPASNALDPNSSDMTLEMWVKTIDVTAELLSNNSANGTACTSNGYYLGIDASGYPVFYLDTNGATAGCDAQISTPTIKVNDGNWHLLAVSVTRGTSATMYLDGVVIGSDTSVTSYSGITVSGNVLVGSTNNFDGVIDSTRFYSRALTQNEILSNYNAGNVELQTRVGTTTDPNDGSWEAWKPTTSETQIDSLDGPYQYNTTDSGLVSYFPLDETSGSATDVKGGNTGTPTGTTIVDGKYGKARYFNGTSDNISIANESNFDFTSTVTLETWFRADATTARKIISKSEGTSTGYEIDINGFTSGNVECGYYSSLNNYRFEGSPYNVGQWHHVVCVLDNTQSTAADKVKLYVDGLERTSPTVSTLGTISTIGLNNFNVRIGQRGDGGAVYFKGSVDETRIYNSALSAATIQQHFVEGTSRVEMFHPSTDTTTKLEGTASEKIQSGIPQLDGSTAGLWHLDETGGSGAYIKDSTTNANNLTPGGGPTLVNGFNGKARYFGGFGSGDILKVTATPTTATTNYTVSAWVKLASLTQTAGAVVHLGNANAGYGITIGSESAPIAGGNNPNSSVVYGILDGVFWLSSGYTIPDTTNWYHIAMTRDTTTTRFYVNGAQTANTYTNTPIAPNAFFSIGGQAVTDFSAPFRYLAGSVDEVKVDTVTRTAEEIAEAYRAGRDHYINKSISSTDLSAKQKLAFNVASDRPGTYLSATIGNNAYTNYQSDANTMGLWHLNEQSGSGTYFKDASGIANNLSVGAGAPIFTQGQIGQSRSFDGSTDYLTCTDANCGGTSKLDIPGSLTLEAWIRPTSAVNDRVIISKWGSNQFSYLLSDNAGKLTLRVSANGGAFTAVAGNTTLSTGQWYHVVGVFTAGSRMEVFLNGASDGVNTTSIPASVFNSTADFALGWDIPNGLAGEHFAGIIDEVRVSNAIRSAADIRAAYEIGKRTHQITSDFAAQLDSGNLITGSSDLSFTVDATKYGLTNKGSNLYLGDKIIVHENYNGTDYYAQGTVNSVTASTGAVTVAAWDSGYTFPSGGQTGFSANANVFKWQREYFDLTGSLSTQRNAITLLTLRETNGLEGRNIWLDDIESAGKYLTGSTITSSTGDRYFQYRIVESSNDYNVSPSVTSVTTDYVVNVAPNTPTLDSPADTATDQSLTPVLKTTATDTESNNIKYKIQLCTDSGMTANCQTFDQTASQTGWSGQNADGNTTYTSGTQGVYTVQSALSAGTTYYWRSYAIDPAGSNTFSSTQGTPHSFTTSAAPTAPTALLTQGQTNPTGLTTLTPYFSAIHHDPDADSANYYQILVNTASDFSGTTKWDSGQTAMTLTADGVRSPNITFAGSALSYGTTYYWKIKFWDTFGIAGAYSSVAQFTLNASPATPTLDSPSNGATGVSLTPALKTTTTDTDSDYLRYKIQLCLDAGMVLGCQFFDETASQTGWSGQNTQGGTAYTSGTQATYTIQTALSTGTTYYWKSYGIDPAGTNTFGSTQSSPNSFTTVNAPTISTACRLQESSNDTSITVVWTDSATDENAYEVQRSVDGGAFAVLHTALAANTTSDIDSTIADGHTYQYRVAPYYTTGPVYADWCTTQTLSIQLGTFSIKGLNLKGLNLH